MHAAGRPMKLIVSPFIRLLLQFELVDRIEIVSYFGIWLYPYFGIERTRISFRFQSIYLL